MAMRDDILKAIQEGGATKESLLKLTGTTEKGLASQFTYLRMIGHCPMKQDDGTFKIVSQDEWNEHRSSGTSAAPLSPEDRVKKAEKRSKRAAAAYDSAKKAHEDAPDDELKRLKFVKAEAELGIAEIELGKAEANLPDEVDEADEEIEEVDEDEASVDDFEDELA